jgi:deoxyribonuclease IV
MSNSHETSKALIRVGVHVSIAGGLVKAVQRAHDLDCDTMQVFSKSPRGWAARPLDPNDADRAFALRQEWGIGPFAVHAPYLINLASADEVLYERSIAAFADELSRCALIRADFLVVHVGCVREGQRDGLDRVARALGRVLQRPASGHHDPVVLLENTAGRRGEVGSRFEELAELVERVGKDRVGVCLDTCHTFAAGYDISTRAGLDSVAKTLDSLIGWSSVKLIHANDSKQGLGSHMDRHQHIGQGAIGRPGFQVLLHHPGLRQIPMVLETPKRSDADDVRNLSVMRSLAGRALAGRTVLRKGVRSYRCKRRTASERASRL